MALGRKNIGNVQDLILEVKSKFCKNWASFTHKCEWASSIKRGNIYWNVCVPVLITFPHTTAECIHGHSMGSHVSVQTFIGRIIFLFI